MLKHTRIDFEFLTDVGSIHRTWCTWRSESIFKQVRADQQQVHASYDSSEPSTYFDVNNLYVL